MIEALCQAEKDTLAVERRKAVERERQLAPKQFPAWGWIAVGVLFLALLVMGVLLGPGLRGKTTPGPREPTAVAVKPTDTPAVTDTSRPPTAAPTHTPTYTSIPLTATTTPPPALQPAIITQVWEKDSSVMVYVPVGEFLMGSTDEDLDVLFAECSDQPGHPCERERWTDELAQHKVDLDAFWIDRTEVTNAQYRRCVDNGVCSPPSSSMSYTHPSYYGNPEFDNYPVLYVNWNQADAYCTWAGKRLPTEAEWEKAASWDAQTGTKLVYPWGNDFEASRANFCDVNCERDWKDIRLDDGFAEVAPVGNYSSGASPYGALNMAGNVWEWVADWYDSDYYANSPDSNPRGPDESARRAVRGCSWHDVRRALRTSNRHSAAPSLANEIVGFRCARSAEP
jgi:formylglycine-generating enzyme required for sulfatase activity